jgi:hypothetical protein
LFIAGIKTGVALDAIVPSPNWPSALLPQQYKELALIAQTVVPDIEIETSVTPDAIPLTSVGAGRFVLEPSPI